jgi:hypothetical protein
VKATSEYWARVAKFNRPARAGVELGLATRSRRRRASVAAPGMSSGLSVTCPSAIQRPHRPADAVRVRVLPVPGRAYRTGPVVRTGPAAVALRPGLSDRPGRPNGGQVTKSSAQGAGDKNLLVRSAIGKNSEYLEIRE